MKILGDNTPPDAWHLIAVHLFLEFQRGKCRYYRVHRSASEKEMYKSFVKMCSNYIPLPKQTKQETQNGQRGGGVRVQTVPELFLWVEKKYKNLHFKMHFNI